jgi:hypothetical protein
MLMRYEQILLQVAEVQVAKTALSRPVWLQQQGRRNSWPRQVLRRSHSRAAAKLHEDLAGLVGEPSNFDIGTSFNSGHAKSHKRWHGIQYTVIPKHDEASSLCQGVKQTRGTALAVADYRDGHRNPEGAAVAPREVVLLLLGNVAKPAGSPRIADPVGE